VGEMLWMGGRGASRLGRAELELDGVTSALPDWAMGLVRKAWVEMEMVFHTRGCVSVSCLLTL